MKKLLVTAFCLTLMSCYSQGAMAQGWDNQNPPPRPPEMGRQQRPPQVNLDEMLNLTEAQKAKAKANRIKSRKAMKPIINSINEKKEAILDVMDSDLSKEQQEAQIKVLRNEIEALHKQANTIREQNMKDFESILTKEQKVKFEQFKKEHKPPKHPQGPKPPKDFN